MNCEQCQNRFDELLDGLMSRGYVAAWEHHIKQCDECRERFEREQAFRQALTDLPQVPMRPAFPAEALAKVRQERARTHRRGFGAGFGSAIAAGLALWFAVTLFMPNEPDTAELQSVSLTIGRVQQVNLVFNSPEHIEHATFSLSLPANTEIDGYPGRRELIWNASLHQGKNRLSLPLRVIASDSGDIVARISHGDREKVFRLKLNVTPQRGEAALFKQV